MSCLVLTGEDENTSQQLILQHVLQLLAGWSDVLELVLDLFRNIMRGTYTGRIVGYLGQNKCGFFKRAHSRHKKFSTLLLSSREYISCRCSLYTACHGHGSIGLILAMPAPVFTDGSPKLALLAFDTSSRLQFHMQSIIYSNLFTGQLCLFMPNHHSQPNCYN